MKKVIKDIQYPIPFPLHPPPLIIPVNYFSLGYLHFYCRKAYSSCQNLTLFTLEKRQYCSEKGFKGTVVNEALSLKI